MLNVRSTGLIASRYHWGNVCKWGECWEVTQKYLTSETERYQFMHFKSLLLSCPRWLQRYGWYTKRRIVNHPKKFSIITGSVILTTPIQSFYMMVQFITRYYQIKFAKGSWVLGIQSKWYFNYMSPYCHLENSNTVTLKIAKQYFHMTLSHHDAPPY